MRLLLSQKGAYEVHCTNSCYYVKYISFSLYVYFKVFLVMNATIELSYADNVVTLEKIQV